MSARNPWLRPAGADGFVPVVVLWDRFAALYGQRWRDLFATDEARAAWQQEAGALFYQRGIRWQMAKAALDKLRVSVGATDAPVSLAKFADLCLPHFDFEGAFAEAKKQAPMADLGLATWTHPAVYWAAVDFGLCRIQQTGWSRAKGEWVRLLTNRLNGFCPPIPEKTEPQEYLRGSPDVARAALSNLQAILAKAA